MKIGVYFYMSEYIQILFPEIAAGTKDILIAELAAAGFEGFEETEQSLKAFIPRESFKEQLLHKITSRLALSWSKEIIKETNWNELWESNFEPVIVNDFCAIRASFHESIKEVRHEIIITPKMSFGTGHHATTYMMIEQMSKVSFTGKNVFDFGTGTGVLAILAEKLGSADITAVDNDDWSISNAAENIEQNQCTHILLKKADQLNADKTYNIILANINKNVILDNMVSLAQSLSVNGILLLSGLLKEDEKDITQAAKNQGLSSILTTEKNNWICIQLSH
jgi:ribosomal protein L11 methyltransferase